MAIEIKVPGFPESVADGTILNWNKQPGDAVKRDESIVDIETDKVVFEVPAPADGILEEVIEATGSVVVSGQLIARLKESGNASVRDSASPEPVPAEPAAATPFATPSAQRMIDEKSLDINSIQGSGSGNRILKEDVIKMLDGQHQPVAGESGKIPEPVVAELQPVPEGRTEKRVPMTRLRARIAERLLDAQHNAAILTTFNEVNMQPVMDLRKRYRESFEKQHGVKLGFMSFFVKAVVDALKTAPEVNAFIEGEEIITNHYYDIGIAVSSEHGLVVPVIRDADRLSLAGIETTIGDLASKARNRTLGIADLQGAVFTITNGGIFGSLLSTPILNPPGSAILGMHSIKKRPIVVDDEIVIRPMMNLAVSYDHRLVDGKEAVTFLKRIVDCLENPERLLLEV